MLLKVFKPEVLISLPRSGSTWLSNCIYPKGQQLEGYWEFFNPVINDKFFHIIGGNRHWWNLLEPVTSDQEYELLEYMKEKSCRYIKECWGVAKLDFFQKHFICRVLTRKTEYTMPGLSNSNVNFFSYIAYYAALLDAKSKLPDYCQAIDFLYHEANKENEKICGAHSVMHHMLTRESRRRNIPVWEYEKISTYDFDDLKKYLKMSDEVARRVIDTRDGRVDSSPFEELGVTGFIQDLRKLLP